jgi:transposase
MAKAMTFVGLDVHARQTHAAVLDPGTGELAVSKLRMAPEDVVSFLAGLGPAVRAVYEAGPTGFGLARAGRERGIDVRVAAPGSIPRGAGDRVKTDRRDAARMVRLLAAGELSFAFVPSVEDECFRDLVRSIEDARGDLMRARHRLSKFLLRRGERYPGPGKAWTRTHMSWLRAHWFEGPCSQSTFVDYLAAVELIAGRRGTLIEALEQAIPACSHADVIARLRCFTGIDTLSAAALCAEIGDFGRFAAPKLLSGFLGVVPSERTSDQKRRQGSITKAGPGHARRLLVEAAHHNRYQPRIGEALARRQQGQDARVVEIAWRAQRRLHQRWQHLYRKRRKHAGVVAIACARELAAFLWEAATLARPDSDHRARGVAGARTSTRKAHDRRARLAI